MPRLLLLALPVVLGVVGWQVSQSYKLEQGPQGWQLVAREAAPAAPAGRLGLPMVAAVRGPRTSIRIASYDLMPLGELKLGKPGLDRVLAQLLARFDVVALQGISTASEDILAGLVRTMNNQPPPGSGPFDYLLGPSVGQPPDTRQFAFVFDTSAVEVDRDYFHTVADPQRVFRFDPLVGAFRTRGVPTNEAFTFTLLNAQLDPARVDSELTALGQLFRAVRDDGRGEDDVILLGDLEADDRRLSEQAGIPFVGCAIRATPTTTRHTAQLDNLLIDARATIEFGNHAGTFDVQRELGLNLSEALELGDHLPIWADFSLMEGGSAPLVSRRPR